MLIVQVVDAIQNAQMRGEIPLTFVVPVKAEAIDRSGLSAATIEDRVQQAMIAELNACLNPEGEDGA